MSKWFMRNFMCVGVNLKSAEIFKMIINRNTKIIGENVILIPYRKEHVLKYHNWMKSDELQKLTASEPLSLEEEYQMQESWLTDENKLTFIVLDKAKYVETSNEIEAMIGDTNLFFANCDSNILAEAEIMIAEKWARGKHRGWEAMLIMFLYAIKQIGTRHFIVKISTDNEASLQMFQKIGFVETCRSEIFQEVTLEKVVDDTWVQWLNIQVNCDISNYQEIK